MTQVLTSLIFSLLCAVPTFAAVKTAPPLGPEGHWRIEGASCADGTIGSLRYESALLRLEDGMATAEMWRENCQINIEGLYSIETTTLTTEFNNGTWSTCSGSLPTYILNRFSFRREKDALFLRGTDLAPFARCAGEGELKFVAD